MIIDLCLEIREDAERTIGILGGQVLPALQ